MKSKQKPKPRPIVVATAHTVAGLREATQLPRGAELWVEIRLDLLAKREEEVGRAIAKIRPPVLLTARHPAEGGAPGLSARDRSALVLRFLPHAAALDVELRACHGHFPDAAGALRIVSFHDFRRTPSLARLRAILSKARRTGADIVKIATHLRTPADLATLLLLQSGSGADILATMGMGPLGKISRLVLASAGSRLVYGYLDRPQVPGQWPALELPGILRKTAP